MIPSRRAEVALSFLVTLLWLLAARASDGDFDKGLLFAVGPASQSPCYLFGTIHSGDPRILNLPPDVEAAFDGSHTFVLEAVPDAEAIIHSMVTMVYTDGRTLKSVVGGAMYEDALEAMAAIGMPEAAIKDFKPWAIVTLLSVPPGGRGEFLDLSLYKAATVAGKEIVGLETMDEQLAVFENLSATDQVALLRETLAVRGQLHEIFERLVLAYLERDLAGLLRLSDEYLAGGDPTLAQRFKTAALDVRNERMAARMTPYLDAGGCFIAVGSLHLPGKGGILERLQDMGYEIRRVY